MLRFVSLKEFRVEMASGQRKLFELSRSLTGMGPSLGTILSTVLNYKRDSCVGILTVAHVKSYEIPVPISFSVFSSIRFSIIRGTNGPLMRVMLTLADFRTSSIVSPKQNQGLGV